MASSPIQISVLMNTTGVAKGASDAAADLDKLRAEIESVDSSTPDHAAMALADLGDEARDSARDVEDLGDAGRDAERDLSRIDDARRDIDKVGDAASDAERELDDLGDAGRDAGRDIERGTSDARRDIDRLEDAFRDVQRQADDTGEAGRDGFRKLSDTSAEVGDELKQNLGETFSSFRGDLEDLPQIAQDTLGGLAGSGALGGIPGLAATAAGAAGIGLVIGAFEKSEEAAEEARQRAADWAQAFIDAGGDIISSAEQVAAIQDIATDPDRYREAKENAEDWQVSVSEAMRIMSGDTTALEAAQRNLDEQTGVTQEHAEDMGITLDQLRQINLLNNDSYRDGSVALQNLRTDMDAGREQAANYSGALQGMINDSTEAIVQTDNLGNAVYTLPDGQQILISAETGQATTNLDNFKGDLDETGQKVVNPTVAVTVDDSAWRNWTPPMKTGYVQQVTIGESWSLQNVKTWE